MFPTTGEFHYPPSAIPNLTFGRRPNIYFNITSPTPGTFIIALHYKGREKAILEMDLKIDDLLEKVRYAHHVMFECIAHVTTIAKRQQAFAGPRICAA